MTPPSTASNAGEKAEKQQAQAAARSEKQHLQNELEDARDDVSRLQSQIAEHERLIDDQAHEITHLQQDKEALTAGARIRSGICCN